MASIYKKYRELVSLIHKYGEKYEKKHGDWIRLHYINGYYFCMDSWNKNIVIIKNPQYKGIFDGFSGKRLVNLEIDFGGFECRISEELLNFYLQNLKCELDLQYDFSNIAV